jgi:hypothetical protein
MSPYFRTKLQKTLKFSKLNLIHLEIGNSVKTFCVLIDGIGKAPFSPDIGLGNLSAKTSHDLLHSGYLLFGIFQFRIYKDHHFIGPHVLHLLPMVLWSLLFGRDREHNRAIIIY